MTERSRKQKDYWAKEHAHPSEITQLDGSDPSQGVVLFYEWLIERGEKIDSGIEMCCGKGRNVLGLAQKGIQMSGFDFVPHAIEEARTRAKNLGITAVDFQIADATTRWPYPDQSFTIGLDCFATADLEDPKGRQFAANELIRVLKPGGLLNVYTLSAADSWSVECLKTKSLEEKNTYQTPEGKFEKCFDREELLQLYGGLTLVTERRIAKSPVFNGLVYPAQHFWLVFQKSG